MFTINRMRHDVRMTQQFNSILYEITSADGNRIGIG